MPSELSTQAGADLNGVRLLAGVDEAGLGPILGPLVVAGAALSGPEGADPWRLLRRLVCRRKQVKGKIRVADSKVVHQGLGRLQAIERTALAFWSAWRDGEVPATVADLLAAAAVDVRPLRRCPWYGALDGRLPAANDRAEMEILVQRLQRELDRSGVGVRRLALRVVDAAELNHLIAERGNKAEAHFAAYADVLGTLLGEMGGLEGGRVVADRCGGRVRYRPVLRRHWPRAQVAVERETAAESSYRLRLPAGREVALTFAERGEDRSFPTALASCLAKYVRELLVEALNAWFAARVPDLRPTAGYYSDGRRFLADVEALVAREGLARGHLVRSR